MSQRGFSPDSNQEKQNSEAGSSGLTVEQKMKNLKISEDHHEENPQTSKAEGSETKVVGDSAPNRKVCFGKPNVPIYWFSVK